MSKRSNREEYNAYMRAYMKRRYHSQRREAFEILGGKCAKCGSEDDLHVDHIDGRTRAFVLGGPRWSRPWAEILEELKKCQLLCRGCHHDKTLKDLGWNDGRKHGNRACYRRGCRCDKCRAAASEYAKEYYRRRKRAGGP